MAWQIIYECFGSGKPVEDFIKSLSTKSIGRVIQTIDLLEAHGNLLRMPHSKKLTKNIFELRIKNVENVRILYAFKPNKTICLLHGFKKKTQKTPIREIKLAEERLKKHLT
jgi:phage-related protein